MKLGYKILIGVGSALAVAGISFGIYRSVQSKKEDDLTIDIGTVDWAKRQVPYVYKNNGKPDGSGTEQWRADLVGKGEVNVVANKRNEYGSIHLPNGLIIFSKSLGTSKGAKIIDFNSKTVKDFTGNASNAIAAATQTLTNLFG